MNNGRRLTPDELVDIAVDVLRDTQAAESDGSEPFDVDDFYEAYRAEQEDRYLEEIEERFGGPVPARTEEL